MGAATISRDPQIRDWKMISTMGPLFTERLMRYPYVSCWKLIIKYAVSRKLTCG